MEIAALNARRCLLGESPHWLADDGVLQQVDIRAGAIFRVTPAGETRWRTELAGDVGFAVPTRSGGIVTAVGRRLLRLPSLHGAPEPIAAVEPELSSNRFNDAKADPAGRLWAGTMSTRREPGVAALYRASRTGELVRALAGATISNGLDWSLDATVMYYIDSTTQQIDAIAFDVDSGTLGRRRRFVAIDAADGLPDGLTVDAAGGVWVALFGGGCVRRYTPSGRLDVELRLPVSCPTSLAFGGADLGTLYVTSSRHRLTDEQLSREPLAGATLVLRPGVAGRAPNHADL